MLPASTPRSYRRRGRGRLIVFAAAAAALAAVTVVAVRTSGSGLRVAAVPAVGKVVPSWSGTTVTGTHLASGSGAGRWLVLNFFATWCEPCQAETPQLVRFAAEHRARGDAEVVGVLFLDSVASARSFTTAHQVGWPLVVDASGAIAARYQVTALPQSFVVDPGGRLVAREFGGVTADELDALVNRGS